MAPGHTPQAPDTITPIGLFGALPHRIWSGRAGSADVSSAALEWPQATPLKPPTRSPQSAPSGPIPTGYGTRAGSADVLVGCSRMAAGHTLQAPETITPIGPQAPSPPDVARARRERRRPRRLLLNGRGPHPSSPRHDRTNRPPGPVPTGCGARASHKQTNSSFDPASCHATTSREIRSRKIRPVGKAATVAGGADPGSGAERLSERRFGGGETAANQRFRSHCLEGCGLSANCGNLGQRPQ
jgi:hypothetical protein